MHSESKERRAEALGEVERLVREGLPLQAHRLV